MSQIFRQLFDKNSFSYTYILGDLSRRCAIFIDTVQEQAERDLKLINELRFERIYLISTHIHADHITGNALIKSKLGDRAISVVSKYYENAKADLKVGDNDTLTCGPFKVQFLHTPGHTAGCLSIVDHANRRVFTGDTLLVRGCGRTDFQGGSTEQLFESIHMKLFQLPNFFTVYPAHDYNGHTASSILEEYEFNPRISRKTKKEFINIMANLNLAHPKLLDVAVPRNLNCGFEDSSLIIRGNKEEGYIPSFSFADH